MDNSINLIPEDIQERRDSVVKEKRMFIVSVVAFTVSLFGLVAILAVFFFYKSSLSSWKEQEVSLGQKVDAQGDIALLVSDLDSRSKKLLSLRDSRLSFTGIISAVSGLLPRNAQLSLLSVNEEGVVLEGFSLDYQSLATIIKQGNARALSEGDEFPFQEVVLRKASLNKESGKVSFTVALSFRADKEGSK